MVLSFGPGQPNPARDPSTIVGYGLPIYRPDPPIVIITEDDMPKVYDLDGTTMLVDGGVATWIGPNGQISPNELEQMIADWCARCGQGGPLGAYQRDLSMWRRGGPVPQYPAGWPRFQVTDAMYRQDPSVPVDPNAIAAAVVAELNRTGLSVDEDAIAAAVVKALDGAVLHRNETLTFGPA
jgi:hypothetical protein